MNIEQASEENDISNSLLKDFTDDSKRVIIAYLSSDGKYITTHLTKQGRMYRKTHYTELFLKAGGFTKMVKTKLDKQERQIEIENLELQNLRASVQIITNELADYEKVRSEARTSKMVSILAIFISLLGLLLQWKLQS